MSLPLPPYGHEVLRSPHNVYVFAGRKSWDDAKNRRKMCGPGSTLVLPHDKSAIEYSWPVKGLELILLWPDGDSSELIQFGKLLIHHRAKLVWALRKPGRHYRFSTKKRGMV